MEATCEPWYLHGRPDRWFKVELALPTGETSYSIARTPKKAFQRASSNARRPRHFNDSKVGDYNRKFRTLRVA